MISKSRKFHFLKKGNKMGTNYYVRRHICPYCGKYEELHIGKSSAGWQFSFHGYEKQELRKIGLNMEIKDFVTWEKILKKEKIFNEYKEEISFEDFIKLIKTKRNEKLNHTIYCRNSENERTRKHGIDECWLDSEGYSFQRNDFS